MLTMLAEQIEDIRRRTDEMTAQKLSNNYIKRVLQEGHVRVVRELYAPTDDITILSSVANQREYALPLDFIDTTDVIWQFNVSHYNLGKIDRKELLNQIPQQGDPSNYAIDEARRSLLLQPIPSGSAQTTTLNGALSSSATTITVVSTTGFGGLGWFKVDNEIIQYTSITSTTFVGCTRGACNTTASTHTTGSTVTWGNIVFCYTRLPIFQKVFYTTGTVTATNGSTTITGVGTNWLAGQNIYAGNYFGIGSLSATTASETFPLTWYKIASVDGVTQITLTGAFNEATASSSVYIVTSMSELYEQDCPIIVDWAEYRCEKILGNVDARENARLSYNSEMSLAKKRESGPDELQVIKNTKWARGYGMSGARAPAHYEKFTD